MLAGKLREGEHMSPFPNDRAEVDVDQTNLFKQFTPNSHFERLTGLDTATGRRPQRPIREFEMHEEYSIVIVQHDRSNSFTKWQGHDVRLLGRASE